MLSEIDLRDKYNLKSIHKINFGHKAAYQIGLIESSTNLDIVKTEFKMYYQVLMEYLKKKATIQGFYISGFAVPAS